MSSLYQLCCSRSAVADCHQVPAGMNPRRTRHQSTVPRFRAFFLARRRDAVRQSLKIATSLFILSKAEGLASWNFRREGGKAQQSTSPFIGSSGCPRSLAFGDRGKHESQSRLFAPQPTQCEPPASVCRTASAERLPHCKCRASAALQAPYAVFTNSIAAEFMQYRSPVGFGPSSNTCPRCPSHSLHFTSVRIIPSVSSSF